MSGPPDLDSTIELDEAGLRVGGRELPMYSGAVHYWRLEREHWRPALRAVKDMGLDIVETYAPWGVHELLSGHYDFGESDPRKDLGAFLDLIAEEGLWAFVRPGPHINAELTYFGLPKRIVYDPACQARSPRQNPVLLFFPPKMFPVPSYASEAYSDEVARWYQRVGSVVSPRIYPEGPVILLQVDNEAAYYFRGGPFDQDYHEDALRLWAEFLKDRYQELDTVAQVYHGEFDQWSDIDPPRSFQAGRKHLVKLLDWMRFQEHLVTLALGRFRDAMASAGMSGTPVLHNIPPGDSVAPMHVPDLQAAVGLVGFDYYHRKTEYPTIKRRTLTLSGTVPFPYSPELGAGIPAWFTPATDDDSLFCALCACAHGLRGFNMYMAVCRDRWIGGPIDSRGNPRPSFYKWKRLLSALRQSRFSHLKRSVDVAVVLPHEYLRLSRATHLYGPLGPSLIEMLTGRPFETSRQGTLDFEHEIQTTWWETVNHLSTALTHENVPYHYIDSEAAPDQWDRYKTICCPTFDFFSSSTWRQLAEATSAGAHVLHGPVLPRFDERLARHVFERFPSSSLVDLTSAAETARAVRTLIDDFALATPYASSPRSIETAIHRDGTDDAILFVIQPADDQTVAEVSLPQPLRLTDAMSGEIFEGGTVATIPMPSHSCRMLIVESLGEATSHRGAP